MKLPWIYIAYCLLVVGIYTVARTEGWVLSSSGGSAGGGSGGHGGGVYLGSHK